jgi:hypothetical protein
VRAVDEQSGQVRWMVDVGRPVADGELLLGRTAVIALGTGDRLLRLDRATGNQLAAEQLPAELRSMRMRGDQLLTVVRFQREEQQNGRELLQARVAETLALCWEYEDEGAFTGAPGVDGAFVAIAGADGDVVLLR